MTCRHVFRSRREGGTPKVGGTRDFATHTRDTRDATRDTITAGALHALVMSLYTRGAVWRTRGSED